MKEIREVRDIADVIDRTSRSILRQKIDGLHAGDEEVVKQVGMGKDIMSILCEYNGRII